MRAGIEKINLYTSPLVTDAVELARARGRDARYAVEEVMVGTRAVIPPWEDAVTLAVNAVRGMLTPAEAAEVELLVVGTESAVDFGKPISTWVHRFAGLSENCRSFEVKHACYGGTAALRMALSWVRGGARPGKKALVVSSDLTRPRLDGGLDFIGGGCAVALLVGSDPQVLEIGDEAGYWTHEICDTFRPTSRAEIGDTQGSLYSYLDALDGAYDHFERVTGATVGDGSFRKHVYHAPFPGMTLQAHRAVLARWGVDDRAVVRAHFDEHVADGLRYGKRIGTAYGASNFVSLLGLLASARQLAAGDRIALFAYGSGCQSELYAGTVGERAIERARALDLDRRLDERQAIDLAGFEASEEERLRSIDAADYEPPRDGYGDAWRRFYAEGERLALVRVRDYRREYAAGR